MASGVVTSISPVMSELVDILQVSLIIGCAAIYGGVKYVEWKEKRDKRIARDGKLGFCNCQECRAAKGEIPYSCT
jgi:hypothetical protein